MQLKLATTINFVYTQLGVAHGNETTILHLLAAVLLANYPNVEAAFHINVTDAYTLLQELKAMIKVHHAKGKLPHHGRVLNYPATVKEFQTLFPREFQAAYPESVYGAQIVDLSFLPEKLPFDDIILAQFAARLPKRITHHGIAARLPRRGGLGGSGALGGNGGNGGSMMGMLSNRVVMGQLVDEIRRQVNPECPGLQILSPSAPPAPALADIFQRDGQPTQSPDKQDAIPLPAPAAPAASTHDPATMAHKLIGLLTPDKKEKPAKKKTMKPKATKGKGKGKKRKADDTCEEPEPEAPKIPAKVITALPYSKPRKGAEVLYKNCKVITDMPSVCWRIKTPEGKQRCIAYTSDPKVSWDRVRRYLNDL